MQITLSMARENCRMNVEEAAKRVGITPKQLMRIEMNPGKTKVDVLIKISLIYGIYRLDHIYIGSEEDWEDYCINYLSKKLTDRAKESIGTKKLTTAIVSDQILNSMHSIEHEY